MISDKDLISNWLESSTKFYRELKDDLQRESNPIYEGLLKLVNAVQHREDMDGTLDFISLVPTENQSPVSLFFFYREWFFFDLVKNRLQEAKILIGKMSSLISSDSDSILKAELLLRSASLEQGSLAEQIFLKGLDLLKPNSHQYRNNVTIFIDELSQKGLLKSVEKKYLKIISDSFRNIFSFIDTVENGQLEKAMKFEKNAINHKEQVPVTVDMRLANSQKLMNLYLEAKGASDLNNWLLSTKALMKGEAEVALKFAKISAEGDEQVETVLTGFGRFALLRAELSNKNISAVKRLLLAYEKDQWAYLFMDFFYARMELLNGNPDKAAKHFELVMKTCYEYDAIGRLDFELELALELKPSQIRFLMESALRPSRHKISKDVEVVPLNIFLKKDKGIHRLKGKSITIDSVKKDVLKYATLDIPVLILGETGVGKDVIANAIHEESKRKDHSFIAINCSAITESLLQSELFGHEAGAYTGANKAHNGIFKEAGEGTVFLDEIGDISSGMQAALLRVLESGEYRPVGSAKPRPLHCRIITATNAMLETRVDEGSFRMDLLFRLKRLVIKVPPLRERRVDIKYLSKYFLNANKDVGEKATFSPDLEEAFQNYSWPGNVRELKNEIEKMRLLHSEKAYYTLEDVTFLSNPGGLINEKPKGVAQIAPNVLSDNQDKEQSIFKTSGSYFRRIEAIKELFLKHKSITRKEVCQIIGASNITIGKDLKKLREEKFIKKLEPTKSPRTHYFILNES